MNPAPPGIVLVLLCSVIEGVAQVCLKRSALAALGKSAWIALGLAFFAAEALLYTAALQTLEVSVAYPLGALSFISVALFSHWLLKESIDRRRWLGLTLILVGCAIVATQR